MAAVNPYLEIIKQIEQKSQLDEQKANSTAQQGQQNAYIGYMTAKKDLGDTLASQGITGGGSESAALGANVGYQRQQNAVMGNRANEVAAIRQNALANKTSTQGQSAQWVNDQAVLEETRFASTVTGYDTIAKVDNAVDAAKDNGETWKIGYLLAQRAALLEQAKNDAEEAAARASYASGSGGGSDTPDNRTLYNNEAGNYIPDTSTFSATQLAGYGSYQPPAGNYSTKKPTVTKNPYYR